MSERLFTFSRKDQAHDKLEEVLNQAADPLYLGTKYPNAECRDNSETEEYEIWSDAMTLPERDTENIILTRT